MKHPVRLRPRHHARYTFLVYVSAALTALLIWRAIA